MTKPTNEPCDLTFPIFVIEKRGTAYVMFKIYSQQSDFLMFSRVPAKGHFNEGFAFDAA